MVHILAGQTEIQEDYERKKSNNYNIWQKSEKEWLRTVDDVSSDMQGHAVVKISKCCKKLQTKKQILMWTYGILF